MAQDVTIAGASFTAVPAIAVPKTGGGIADFFDLTGDTITAAGLLDTMTAHDATGAAITGTLIDGITNYKTDALAFDTSEAFGGHIINIGFVPRLFVIYATSAITVPTGYIRYIMGWMIEGFKSGSGSTVTASYRSMVCYTSSGNKMVAGGSSPAYHPYESGATKGVQVQGTANNYMLEGNYRYFAFA